MCGPGGEHRRAEVGLESAGDRADAWRGARTALGMVADASANRRSCAYAAHDLTLAEAPDRARFACDDDHYRLRLPGPGVPIGRHGPRRSPRPRPRQRPSSPQRTKPSASRSRRLAWEGPEDQLNRTENAQPALLATSIAYLVAARERAAAAGMALPAPRFIAGHSMGQYSAMVAAGALTLAGRRPARP